MSTQPFHAATPILSVRDLKTSLEYYQRVLGFTRDWHTPSMISVGRGDAHLMLCLRAQGYSGTWVWIGVGDAEGLFREFTASGATIRLPPTNYPWALEIHVEDPDGHVLRFGSGPLTDRPFSEWVQWYVDRDDRRPG